MALKLSPEQAQAQEPTWFDPITKLVSMLMNKPNEPAIAAMPGMVTGHQAARALKALEALQGWRFGPSSAQGNAIEELPKNLRDWAATAWKNVGGPGRAKVTPLGSGAESAALGVQPRSEVLKIFHPDTPTGVTLSSGKVLPTMLPTLEWGVAPNRRFGYMVQPQAKPIVRTELFPNRPHPMDRLLIPRDEAMRIQKYLQDETAKHGGRFVDTWYDNIGLWNNKPYILDYGAVRLP